ncbi:MAG: hypothetical protein EOO43_15750 [Flavobacterium sp.]|nr:MAG: hypothetical protein EOO43_15750 [Flavobacterium sp.]
MKGIIYQNAELISKSKILIQKKMMKIIHRVPEYFLHPLLMFAEYSVLLNYSIDDHAKYNDAYARKYQKFSKVLEGSSVLCEENLYENDTAFLIISADKLENGCIVHTSESLQNICGPDRSQYKGVHITKLFPPGFRAHYE